MPQNFTNISFKIKKHIISNKKLRLYQRSLFLVLLYPGSLQSQTRTKLKKPVKRYPQLLEITDCIQESK